VMNLIKMMNRKIVNLMKIKRFESNHWKSEHYEEFLKRNYTYTS
jgi:hypothetical protein